PVAGTAIDAAALHLSKVLRLIIAPLPFLLSSQRPAASHGRRAAQAAQTDRNRSRRLACRSVPSDETTASGPPPCARNTRLFRASSQCDLPVRPAFSRRTWCSALRSRPARAPPHGMVRTTWRKPPCRREDVPRFARFGRRRPERCRYRGRPRLNSLEP